MGAYRPPEAQLGLLSCFLRDSWLVSWNEYSVFVLDWVHEVKKQLLLMTVSTCRGQTTALKWPLRAC